MLIDDDEPTNYLSKMVVASTGCTDSIHVATSGEKALSYLTSGKEIPEGSGTFPGPDLIFLDINMPAMNGWEFLEQYKKLDPQHKGNIVIIMLTTSLNPDDKWKSGEMTEIAGFENKPLTKEKLERILARYFPGPGAV